jgi:hypothetical protein
MTGNNFLPEPHKTILFFFFFYVFSPTAHVVAIGWKVWEMVPSAAAPYGGAS